MNQSYQLDPDSNIITRSLTFTTHIPVDCGMTLVDFGMTPGDFGLTLVDFGMTSGDFGITLVDFRLTLVDLGMTLADFVWVGFG